MFLRCSNVLSNVIDYVNNTSLLRTYINSINLLSLQKPTVHVGVAQPGKDISLLHDWEHEVSHFAAQRAAADRWSEAAPQRWRASRAFRCHTPRTRWSVHQVSVCSLVRLRDNFIVICFGSDQLCGTHIIGPESALWLMIPVWLLHLVSHFFTRFIFYQTYIWVPECGGAVPKWQLGALPPQHHCSHDIYQCTGRPPRSPRHALHTTGFCQ